MHTIEKWVMKIVIAIPLVCIFLMILGFVFAGTFLESVAMVAVDVLLVYMAILTIAAVITLFVDDISDETEDE